MKVTCDYCGQALSDTDAVCPSCGAPNNRPRRGGSRIPQTIAELKAFCERHELPLEKMRFFIGQDYRGAKAFGIYQDTDGSFVVYKNKANGERAVRYRGPDEAFAVNELYQRMRAEVTNQRSHQSTSRSGGTTAKRSRSSHSGLTLFLIAAAAVLVFSSIKAAVDKRPNTGYYNYNDNYYYYQNDDWYLYDLDELLWLPAQAEQELVDHYSDYYESYSYSGDYDFEDFRDSDYYEPYSSSSSDDWDDDYWDWDSGSDWDSGWTDWDSDW